MNWTVWGANPARWRHCSVLQTAETNPETHSASCSTGMKIKWVGWGGAAITLFYKYSSP